MSRFKLRNLDVDRVDLVDLGANPDAHVIISKRATASADLVQIAKECGGLGAELRRKKRRGGTAFPEDQDVRKAMPGPGMPAPRKPQPPVAASGPGISPFPFQRPAVPAAQGMAPKPFGAPATPTPAAPGATPVPGASKPLGVGQAPAAPSLPAPAGPPPAPRPAQVARFVPEDFDLAPSSGNRMKEWRLRPDRLPEGVEEASITMMSEGETPLFQWLIDPAVGPPVEGTAKSAAEALMSLRSAVMTHAATQAGQLLPMGGPGGAKPAAAVGKPAVPGGGSTLPSLQMPQRPAALAKHYGPGPHPSGSPQESHGSGGGMGGSSSGGGRQTIWWDKHTPPPEGPGWMIRTEEPDSERSGDWITTDDSPVFDDDELESLLGEDGWETIPQPDAPNGHGWRRKMSGNSKRLGKRLRLAKRNAQTLDTLLTTVAKSLSEVEVFRPGTSGSDLRAILSPDAVAQLSALMERPERHGTTGGM